MSKRDSLVRLLERNDARFIGVAHTITADEWASPSLCDGWSNLDVLAHLVIGCSMGLTSVATAMAKQRGSFDRANTAMTQALSRQHPASALLERYAVVSGRPSGIGRLFPKNLLLGDHVIHELDIVLALDRTPTIEPGALAAVLQTEVSIPNPFVPAKRTAAGLDLHAVDNGWSRPAGHAPTVAGPGWAIASVLANRPKALDSLHGDGVVVLADRLSRRGCG
jgi:uncharacterized protein (TIGR03083 family)